MERFEFIFIFLRFLFIFIDAGEKTISIKKLDYTF